MRQALRQEAELLRSRHEPLGMMSLQSLDAKQHASLLCLGFQAQSAPAPPGPARQSRLVQQRQGEASEAPRAPTAPPPKVPTRGEIAEACLSLSNIQQLSNKKSNDPAPGGLEASSQFGLRLQLQWPCMPALAMARWYLATAF